MRPFSKQLALQNNIVRCIASLRHLIFNVEVLICVLIITTVAGIAASQYTQFLHKSRQAELFSILPIYKGEFVIEHAFTGRWSKNTDNKRKILKDATTYSPIKITNSYFSQGNFAISYESSEYPENYTLAYRLVHKDQLQPTLYWVCGRAEKRPDEAIRIPNITDLPKELLFQSCK